jgi:hypothetical protein
MSSQALEASLAMPLLRIEAMTFFEVFLMVCDSADAAYADEQERRAQQDDDWAREWEEAVYSLKEMIEHWGVPALYAALSLLPEHYSLPSLPPVTCSECVNWQTKRQLHLVDGSTRTLQGFCAARAAADLPQMSQDYAQQCRLFEQAMPF